ncbi:molybdate ABC transporter ATP-binding protein ModF [Akkermansiaceae bacterium]|nr:molybdate ABC transporter ATP-binding protein ModF [Akkermansiaceae bacterium]MDB4536987.1 molybdate ABC transporter ATP-binding protein ModF [Akkermansiaceae bacterium]
MPSITLQQTPSTRTSVKVDQLTISSGETWGIVGRNAGGKSTLAVMLTEKDRHSSFKQIGHISFELEDALLEREIREDDSEFLDKIDPGRTVLELIQEVQAPDSPPLDDLIKQLGLTDLTDRGFRLLSTGERRRLMLARALILSPDLLILDEPFDGLDQEFRAHLTELLQEYSQTTTLVIVANRLSDLDTLATHLACIDQGECVLSGPRHQVESNPAFTQLMELDCEINSLPSRDPAIAPYSWTGPLVSMNQVTVVHGGREIISSFDWLVERGHHWKISGPNGCGKSTLVNLVSGDHTQCYSNNVTVMGMRRGQGETIWDIKNHLGIVSPALHQQYRVSTTALTVIVSGFFDSVGLYQEANSSQLKIAREWLEVVGMTQLADRPFRSLSFGQQRLLLIARALVKQPPLLILDEPCQGLDGINRALVLRVIDRIAATELTQLLYITHEPEDHLDCLTHELVHDGNNWKKLVVRP